MLEKRKPTHKLDDFKAAFSQPDKLHATKVALKTAASLGFGRSEIVETIQSMRGSHFYKSMTANDNIQAWQDVYHVPSNAGVLYVKFTAFAITEFLLLSFKEREND